VGDKSNSGWWFRTLGGIAPDLSPHHRGDGVRRLTIVINPNLAEAQKESLAYRFNQAREFIWTHRIFPLPAPAPGGYYQVALKSASLYGWASNKFRYPAWHYIQIYKSPSAALWCPFKSRNWNSTCKGARRGGGWRSIYYDDGTLRHLHLPIKKKS